MATTKKPKAKLKAFIKKNRDQYPTDSWVVFTKNGKLRKYPRVFEGNLTRDKVRSTYATTMGVPIQETRSRRVENY